MSGRTGKWGNPEWEKTKYKTGKIIFSNATKQDTKWTPNGQDVTLTIGSTKKRLAPGERYEFQPKDNGTITLVAKPQLSTMKKSEVMKITNPLSYDDHHIWIWARVTGQFKLGFFQASQGPPR